MPKIIINGTRGPIVMPIEYTFDPQRGAQVVYRFRSYGGSGPLAPILRSARSSGRTTRMIDDPLTSELEISSPDPAANQQQFATDTWQITGNGINESVFSNPIVKANISYNDRAVIARMHSKGMKAADAIADLAADGLGAFTAPNTAASLQLMREVVDKSQDSYSVGQYVLRHTTNCSSGYSGNISDTNVFLIYSTAQLLSEVENTSLWANPIPGRLIAKIASIPIQTPADDEAGFYFWGWLKQPSTEISTPDNRVQIDTEYWLGLWSLLRYSTI